MDQEAQKTRAERFHALHHADAPLILVNAWDVASARSIAKSSPAVATSSAGVAASRGYADGEDVPRGVVLEFVERLTASVEVPVSVDFEAGYGDDGDGVTGSIEAVIRAGAVGVNLEDGLVGRERRLAEAERHAEKIAAARRTADASGVRLFINARTDPFWLRVGSPDTCLEMALERARLYAEAGADGIFVPRLLDIDMIATFVREIALPVNILAMPEGPSLDELAAAGVKRISLGSWPARAAMQDTEQIAREIAAKRTLDPLRDRVSAS